jgi:integrase
MATLTVDRRAGEIVGYNIQWCENRRRYTIYLSSRTYRRKTAERFKEMVETLVYYRKNGTHVPDKAVANWLTTAPAELQAKLAKVGLINVTKSKTCQELWDACLKHKKTAVKETSMKMYRQCQEHFFKQFSTTELIEKITAERLLEWKTSMQSAGQAVTSVAKYVQATKMVFDWAVDHDWLTKNPGKNIPNVKIINRDKDRMISMEEYAKLLDACPSQDWRTIIAMARIGGLRCPSELLSLRWSDIDWVGNRFLVRSPKTERYSRHRERVVPLFPELRKVLERHFALDEAKGNEFVIQGFQGTTWQLKHGFDRIAVKSGLGVILKPFVNMRKTRSNEVVRDFGEVKESLWIGHSTKVMREHYFCLSDDDFLEAAGGLGNPISHAKSHAKLAVDDGIR